MERAPTGSSASPPICRYTFDGRSCRKRGAHFCGPRADRAQAFIEEVCVHTKSVYARQPFTLEDWQRDEIVRPLFGTVVWTAEFGGRYVRRYTVAWVELGRGNGKSELAAAIVLLLLVGDDEESAEVYGAAMDTKQAGKVGEVVKRMYELSPVLAKRLIYNKQARRLVDPRTNSYYEVIPGDAEGELGHNPYGAVIDEVLTQASPELWDALRTAQGKRPWSLLLGFTTAGNDPAGFAAAQHAEMQRVADDPARAPHVLVYMRNTPADADPWDERNWYVPNPGLGRFLSVSSLREEALEARNDPSKENAFRQFRLNQWVQQTSRWMPMHLWDACVGDVWATPDWARASLAKRTAWAGFDLAAKMDLTAWCLLLPPAGNDTHADLLWRFWLPEAAVPELDKRNNGAISRWAADGWITVAGEEVLDYDRVYADVEADARHFRILGGDGDQWSMAPVIQELEKRAALREGFVTYNQTFERMTPGMTDLMGLVREERIAHHANPVARWCFDGVEVRRARYNPDLVRPDKPERNRTGKRIDAVSAAAMAVAAWRARGRLPQKKSGRRVVGY